MPTYKQTLLNKYMKWEVDGIMQVVKDLTESSEFPPIYARWVRENKIPQATLKIEKITQVLLDELEKELQQKKKSLEASFDMVAESLEKKFNKEVSRIYLESQEPGDLLEAARFFFTGDVEAMENERLSETMVNRFKNELIRIEKGRRAIVYVLQAYSHFPIKNTVMLTQLFKRTHLQVKANYQYIGMKPLFLRILSIANPVLDNDEALAQELKKGNLTLFADYIANGEEPSLLRQIELRIAISKLLKSIAVHQIIPLGEYKQIRASLLALWTHKGLDLSYKARVILTETLHQVILDKQAVTCRLADTFVGEFQTAAQEMGAMQHAIVTQLANTQLYLENFDQDETLFSELEQKNFKTAQEKQIGLDGIFDLGLALGHAKEASSIELERVALGVPAHIGVSQLVAWIQIYSIIFSNADFLKYARGEVDLAQMRTYISNLSTYHLIQNIADLRALVDRVLANQEQEAGSHFQRFNDALRNKLQSLMKSKQKEEKTLEEMIDDLDFIKDSQVQFLVAEAFKGFQILMDTFNSSAESYFVQDRQILMKESREIYQNICNQCLKNFTHKPMPPRKPKNSEQSSTKKSGWLSRLFS